MEWLMNYTKHFSEKDIHLILQALDIKAKRLRIQRETHIESTAKPVNEIQSVVDIDHELNRIQELKQHLQ
jgi:ferritin-like metal-binding protein YciE